MDREQKLRTPTPAMSEHMFVRTMNTAEGLWSLLLGYLGYWAPSTSRPIGDVELIVSEIRKSGRTATVIVFESQTPHTSWEFKVDGDPMDGT